MSSEEGNPNASVTFSFSLRTSAQELFLFPRFCHDPLVDFHGLKQCVPKSMSPCITRTLGSVHKVGKDVILSERNEI